MKIKWSEVDWSKTNMQLAISLGLNAGQGYVASVHKKLGKPPSPDARPNWARKKFGAPRGKR